MGFYKFGLLIGCVFFLTIDAVEAVQCYQCSYTNTYSDFGNFTEGDAKCKDPFDSTDITVVECSGQCYVNFNDISFYGSGTETFSRGCATNDVLIDCESSHGCLETAGYHGCTYCCDQENCNNLDITEFEENLFKCYTCTAVLDANGMPVDNSSTCGLPDFDGTGFGVAKTSCKPGTSKCFTYTQFNGTEYAIARSCAEDPLLPTDPCEFYGSLPNAKIDCCTDQLCNDGAPPFPEPPVTREPLPAIDCYFCEANLTTDGLPVDQSSCGRADFDGSGQDVTLLSCDSGVCATAYLLGNDMSLVQRSCLPSYVIDACDNPAILGFIFPGYEIQAECCYEDECNTVNLLMPDTDTTAATTATEILGDTMTTYTSGADGVAMFAASTALVVFSTLFFAYEVL